MRSPRPGPADMRILLVHGGLLVILAILAVILPAYHQGNLARIMVLATFAMGYNLMFGYVGLLSLGHALFFAAGMYGFGLAITLAGLGTTTALGLAVLSGVVVSAVVGLLALRTRGVAFMIVTLMFAQAGALAILYFRDVTRGDEGFVVPRASRALLDFSFATPLPRVVVAFIVFAVVFIGLTVLVRSSFGRVLVAIRENEERTRMLGYDVWRHKLIAIVVSGTICAFAGALYALLFGYVGQSFASVQYSILPLLWTLIGGAGTVIGPLIGTAFLFYLIDYASDFTDAYLIVVGIVLLLVTLFARSGIAGTVRDRYAGWLP